MNNCKTCKYWGKKRKEHPHMKTCRAPNIFYGYHHKIDELPNTSALVEDDEGWGMFTGPDFGCVLHEQS